MAWSNFFYLLWLFFLSLFSLFSFLSLSWHANSRQQELWEKKRSSCPLKKGTNFFKIISCLFLDDNFESQEEDEPRRRRSQEDRPQLPSPKKNQKKAEMEPSEAEGGHRFQVHTYKSPTWCDFCKDFIWGVARQGLRCKSKCPWPVCTIAIVLLTRSFPIFPDLSS